MDTLIPHSINTSCPHSRPTPFHPNKAGKHPISSSLASTHHLLAPSIAGTTVGNVPGSANIGLGTGEAPDLTPKQSVVGDPEVLAGSKIEPLDKQASSGMSPFSFGGSWMRG